MVNGEKKLPLVSIVILNYNGEGFVKACLDSITALNYPNFEVIFIDNASDDSSVDIVYKAIQLTDLSIHLIRNKNNLGYAAGNNIGLKKSKGKYVFFLNIDTEVNSDGLRELVITMEKDPKIGAAQSKLLLSHDRAILDSSGGFLDYYGFCSARGRGEVDKDQQGVSDIFYARGAALAVQREVLNKVGSFDPSFFLQCEEVDLCWRIWLHGYRVVYVPKSIVYHAGGGILRKIDSPSWSRQMRFHEFKNTISMLLKNYELDNFLFIIPITFFIMLGVALFPVKRLDLSGALNRVGSLLKASKWILINFKNIWGKRLIVQYLIRKVPDKTISGMMLKKPVVLKSIC